MTITDVKPLNGTVLQVHSDDGRTGTIDVSPYLESPVFAPLKSENVFAQVRNGKYYVEWPCGADLSADTLEARMNWSRG